MKELLLDANIILRHLLQDHASQGPAASALFADAGKGRCRLIIDALVIAECVYVLTGYYARDRKQIAFALDQVVQGNGIEVPQRDIVRDALQRYSKTQVDFQDAWLAANAVHSTLGVASFDRDFDKFADIMRFEPGRDSL